MLSTVYDCDMNDIHVCYVLKRNTRLVDGIINIFITLKYVPQGCESSVQMNKFTFCMAFLVTFIYPPLWAKNEVEL